MGRIRDKMKQDLVLLGRSAATRESYLLHARAFVKYLGRSPSTASTDDVRRWLLYLLQEKRSKPATVNVALGALKFLFRTTLGRREVVDGTRSVRPAHPEPDVLSGSEVAGAQVTGVASRTRIALVGLDLAASDCIHRSEVRVGHDQLVSQRLKVPSHPLALRRSLQQDANFGALANSRCE